MSEAQNPLWAVVGNRGFEPSDRPVPWLFNHMSDAQGKADHLNRFDNTNQYYAAPVFVVRKEWVKAVQDRADLARAQVAAVKVKPLVWESEDGNPACQDANGCGKLYRVIVHRDGTAVLRHDASLHDQETYGSEEAAKAAAQTDCECRVFEMLAHVGDANAVVAAAYEAAAQEARSIAERPRPDNMPEEASLSYFYGARDAADAIRVLTHDDAKAALDAERAKAHKDGQAAAFKKVIGHMTYNKPDEAGNHRAQGYYRGWMDALAAMRKMAKEDGK